MGEPFDFEKMVDTGRRWENPRTWIADSLAGFIEMLVQTPEMPVKPTSEENLKENVRAALEEILDHCGRLGERGIPAKLPESRILTLKSWLRDEIMTFLNDSDLWTMPGSRWSKEAYQDNIKPAIELLIQDIE